MRSDTIHLHKIHAPVRILLHQSVIPGLPCRVRLYAKIIRIPRAHIRTIRSHARTKPASPNSRIRRHRLLRNPANNVNSELQPILMRRLGQRFEARPVLRGRETIRCRLILAMFIRRIPQSLRLRRQLRVLQIPSLIHHHILPAELLQLRRQHRHVLPKLFLINRQPIRVPAVPAHRRRRCQHLLLRTNRTYQSQCESSRKYRLHPHGDKHTKFTARPDAARDRGVKSSRAWRRRSHRRD